jgi:hypothetical protein
MGVHGIPEAIHADRGTSMTSKPVVQLMVDLGVARSHSRPHVSNDNPYSEAAFKTLKYAPVFPKRFGSLADARAFGERFFSYYNHEHRHSGIGLHPGVRALRHRERAPRPAAADPERGRMPLTPNASATAGQHRRSCPPSPGSTSHHRRPSYRPLMKPVSTCLTPSVGAMGLLGSQHRHGAVGEPRGVAAGGEQLALFRGVLVRDTADDEPCADVGGPGAASTRSAGCRGSMSVAVVGARVG